MRPKPGSPPPRGRTEQTGLRLDLAPRRLRLILPPFVPAKAGTHETQTEELAMSFFVYMLASKRNGTLYIGMTDDVIRRTWQHRAGAVPGFTNEHAVKSLVWYEVHETRESAFQRERQMKKWNRAWKIKLIERDSTLWRDLFDDIARL
jgi:putative endonuclease